MNTKTALVRTDFQTPSLLDAASADAVWSILAKLDPPFNPAGRTYSLPSEYAPRPEMRRMLEARSDRLRIWLEPSGQERVLRSIASLYLSMSSRSGNDGEIKAEKRQLAMDLADVPAFALSEACEAFRRGDIGDGKWVPKGGEIRVQAMKRVYPLSRERREIDAVLTATVVAPINRARREALITKANDLVSEMRAASEATRRGKMSEQELFDARVVSEMMKNGTPDPRPLPKLSPYLAGKLGLLPAATESEPARREDAA